MDPRLQAGVELQLEKQAQQAHNSSLSGVLGSYFKQGADTPAEGKSPTFERAKKQTEGGRSDYYTEAAKADQARADAGTISLPAAKPGEVSVQAEEQARLFALEAAKADQARADAGTVSLPAVSERDKLMASLPEHLQTEPKPGTPDWDYWNTMVQLHIKRLNRSRTSWGKRP